jgi:hypothetical protein
MGKRKTIDNPKRIFLYRYAAQHNIKKHKKYQTRNEQQKNSIEKGQKKEKEIFPMNSNPDFSVINHIQIIITNDLLYFKFMLPFASMIYLLFMWGL